MATKWSIEVNSAQALLISNALELLVRVGIGQFEALLFHHYELNQETLDALKASIKLEKGRSRSMYDPDLSDEYRVAWDLYQVIRNKLAWHESPQGGLQLMFDEPRMTNKKGMPLCGMTKVEDTNESKRPNKTE